MEVTSDIVYIIFLLTVIGLVSGVATEFADEYVPDEMEDE